MAITSGKIRLFVMLASLFLIYLLPAYRAVIGWIYTGFGVLFLSHFIFSIFQIRQRKNLAWSKAFEQKLRENFGAQFAAFFLFDLQLIQGLLAVIRHPVKNLRGAFQSYFAPPILAAIFWTFVTIMFMEMSVIHILIDKISSLHWKKWIHILFIISDVCLFEMFLGHLYHLQNSYVQVQDSTLNIKLGLKWRMDIPLSIIKSISRLDAMATEQDSAKVNIIETPKVRIELAESHTVQYFFRGKAVRIIHLWLKDEDIDRILSLPRS